MRSPLTVDGALVSPTLGATPRGAALLESMRAASVTILDVSQTDFASASSTDSPQGVLAIAEIPERDVAALTFTDHPRVLVLDGLQDPGNVGTLLRTAAAFGVDATLAMPDTVDLWNAKVVRSAMGAHFLHPAFHCTWDELRLFLDEARIPMWGADTGGAPVRRTTAPRRLALAVGNEGAGLSADVRDGCSQLVSLPLDPGV
ncbi:MAG TPA: RNA methyltransferase, partial [Gemmatimonadaceae bacterium]|nr:RNA methyltransferase [Gemmatimonadaceae bacterium]